MKKILVTDSLFISAKHEQQIRDAGYEIERLDKPDATEGELVRAIVGKVGYILGGIEHVTEKVIEAGTDLRAIAFTGTDWKEHIPAWQAAASREIHISNTPYTNSRAMAEWALAGGLAMVRNLFALGRTGDQTFLTSPGFEELQVGIVGFGHIGSALADLYSAVGAHVAYWNRTPRQSNYEALSLDELLRTSDIICFCVSADAGKDYVDAKKLGLLKEGAILTVMRESTLDERALLKELEHSRIRAFLDYTPALEGYRTLPLEIFYCSNSKSGYNTTQANTLTSDMATESLLNLLATGQDRHRVI